MVVTQSQVESEFKRNSHPRRQYLFALDTSGSMQGEPIAEVIARLKDLKETLGRDSLARKRAEVGLLTFGGDVKMVAPFRPAEEFEVPELVAAGSTPMASAIEKGLDEISSRVETVKAAGLMGGRPMLILLTDGASTEGEAADQRAAKRLIEAQKEVLLEKGPRRMSPYFVPMIIVNMAPGLVSIRFGIKGPNFSHVSACSTGAHSIGEAMRTIQHGDVDAMIAGGCEATITPLGVGGFNAMRALSTRNSTATSRPVAPRRASSSIG